MAKVLKRIDGRLHHRVNSERKPEVKFRKDVIYFNRQFIEMLQLDPNASYGLKFVLYKTDSHQTMFAGKIVNDDDGSANVRLMVDKKKGSATVYVKSVYKAFGVPIPTDVIVIKDPHLFGLKDIDDENSEYFFSFPVSTFHGYIDDHHGIRVVDFQYK